MGLGGIVHAQKISFTNNTIAKGTTLWKTPVTATFTFTNKERTPLVIKDVDAGCGCLSVDWTKTPVEKGGKGEVKVTYDAKQLGTYDRFIDVYTNGSAKPVKVRMSGRISNVEEINVDEMFPYVIDNVRVSTNNIEFPDVYGGDSATVKIEVYNAGREVYTPQLMHVPSYITMDIKPKLLAAGRRGVIELTVHGDLVPELGLNQTSVYVPRFPGDKVGPNKEIGVSAVLLPGFSDLTDFQRMNAPKLQLSSDSLDINLEGKKKKTTTLILQNIGKDMLDIQEVQMFTVGLQLQLNKRHLAPGEEAKLKITIKDEIKSARTKPRILMITNDPDRAKVVINLNVK